MNGGSMKIVQTVIGKFHHFDLARQLHKRGMLETIFSSYPRWVLRNEQIPMEKIKTFPWLHAVMIAKWKYLRPSTWLDRKLNRRNGTTLDGFVARRIPDCDVFVGISGTGLRTGELVQKRGGKYICDRGSSHARYADRVLREEFRRWGQEFEGIDPCCIAREEAEYELADAITVPSEFALRSFIEIGVPACRVRKIPYGVDLTRFAKVADPPRDSFEVLFVGQVSFRKGVPYLLEAFERFSHPRKRLTMVGAVQPEMKAFLRRKELDAVTFLGPVEQSRLKNIMSRSHVMVLPSVEEGLACVQGQALACGCPLISSTNSGGEDLFQHGKEGFIVPVRDARGISERLEQLAQDADLRRGMSEAAVRRVKQLGGWDAYGSAYAALCQELAGVRQEERRGEYVENPS